ncbi:MAG: KH domain-containing protein [bacterium]|jgi:predicted RNA-binding protein YlqC (UPF0109 family)
MQDLVEYIAKALVDHPEDVQINCEEDSRAILLRLQVAPDDMGKIIGKSGRIAKAMRTVVNAAATRTGKRVTVEIG